MPEDVAYTKFYCAHCGAWLGVKVKGTLTKGIYPYCKKCKKNVKIVSENNKKSADVP